MKSAPRISPGLQIDSQIVVIIHPQTQEIIPLGSEIYTQADLEDLDVHPLTGELYTSSGADGQRDSELFLVHAQTGALTSLGILRDEQGQTFQEVSALSFRNMEPYGDLPDVERRTDGRF